MSGAIQRLALVGRRQSRARGIGDAAPLVAAILGGGGSARRARSTLCRGSISGRNRRRNWRVSPASAFAACCWRRTGGRKDNGPLIGHIAETHSPVALLPDGRGRTLAGGRQRRNPRHGEDRRDARAGSFHASTAQRRPRSARCRVSRDRSSGAAPAGISPRSWPWACSAACSAR